ncbi:MAG: hypothetical protein QOC92_507 [Acidimicrobiaceae bacterium]|jgi:hypothetical protein
MASTTLMYRRALRTLREQPLLVRCTAAAVVAVLVIDLAALGAKSGTSDSSHNTAAAGRRSTVAAGAQPTAAGSDSTGSDVRSAPAGAAGGTGAGDGSPVGGTALGGDFGGPPPDRPQLTASDRGVTETTVKVVFPWFDIGAYTSASGTTTDEPLEGGPDAITAYVNYINATGGLDGRMIDPIIEEFNPLNETDMEERCRRWTEDDKVFAVVDSQAWHSSHQLCITADHQTPLVTNLGLAEKWPQDGAPYLWYTAPTSEETIDDWVLWMVESGQLIDKDALPPGTTPSVIGVVTGVKEEEKLGKAAIERALDKVGLLDQARFREIPGYTADIGLAQPAIATAIADFKTPGNKVDRLLMGLSALVFTTWMNQADAQDFYPQYELSDFNNTITVADALLASDHPKSLKDAVGPSYIRLGEVSPANGGTFAPAQQRCNEIWRAANPNAHEIDGAGVAMRWCDNIFLFAEGARRATRTNSGVLTRQNWAEAMATIQGVEAGMSPTLSFSPGDYSGPTMTKVVKLRTEEQAFCTGRDPADDANCLEEIAPYVPMRRFS